MSDWYVKETSSDAGVLKAVIQTSKSRVAISASEDSIVPAEESEINQGAAKVVCTVGGLSPEDTVALLRLAKDGIEHLLRTLTH